MNTYLIAYASTQSIEAQRRAADHRHATLLRRADAPAAERRHGRLSAGVKALIAHRPARHTARPAIA